MINGNADLCALDIPMNVVEGKWKMAVVWHLRDGRKRFSEMRRLLPTVTEKMRSLQLRSLERDGVLEGTVYPEVPPRIEHALTDPGKSLLPVLEAMATRGRRQAGRYTAGPGAGRDSKPPRGQRTSCKEFVR